MKKIATILLTAITMMAFMSCQPATDKEYTLVQKITDDGTKIAAPSVNATYIADSGIIRLTWKKVDAAAGYLIYKKFPTATDNNTEYFLIKTTTDLYYNDIVKTSNPMVPGNTYEYVVVSKSSAATASDTLSTTEAKTEFSFTLPASSTVPAKGTTLTLTGSITTTPSASSLYVTIPTLNNIETYEVSLVYGSATIQPQTVTRPFNECKFSGLSVGSYTVRVRPLTAIDNSDWFNIPQTTYITATATVTQTLQ